MCYVTTFSSVLTSTEQLLVDMQSRDDFIAYYRNYLIDHDIDLIGDEES